MTPFAPMCGRPWQGVTNFWLFVDLFVLKYSVRLRARAFYFVYVCVCVCVITADYPRDQFNYLFRLSQICNLTEVFKMCNGLSRLKLNETFYSSR